MQSLPITISLVITLLVIFGILAHFGYFKLLTCFVCFFILGLTFIAWKVLYPPTFIPPNYSDLPAQYEIETKLHPVPLSSNPELLVRYIDEDPWSWSGKATGFKVEPRPMWGTTTVRLEAQYALEPAGEPRILLGRISDPAEIDLFGWHVTLVRVGTNQISLGRHQRYRTWIDQEQPKSLGDDGAPQFTDPNRVFLHGMSDVIAEEEYEGYVPPTGDDL